MVLFVSVQRGHEEYDEEPSAVQKRGVEEGSSALPAVFLRVVFTGGLLVAFAPSGMQRRV